jgi:hypothetical protein
VSLVTRPCHRHDVSRGQMIPADHIEIVSPPSMPDRLS